MRVKRSPEKEQVSSIKEQVRKGGFTPLGPRAL
jgi:hypothetical protein